MTSPRNKSPISLPSQARLNELLEYRPSTGYLTWKVQLGSRALVGQRAGCVKTERGKPGHRAVRIDRVLYQEHRIIWVLVYGKEPVCEIDHINGNAMDNRLCNLREATGSENRSNIGLIKSNTSGLKGVGWHKAKNKWRAYIGKDGRYIHLGLFEKKSDAAAAYAQAAKKYFGEYARIN